MNCIRVPIHGSSSVLETATVKTPRPSSGEVRIAVSAVGVNFADIKRRRGDVKRLQQTPYVPGIEAAGTVDAVGEGVADLEIGDRVAAYVGEGSYAEQLVADADAVFRIPDDLSFDEGAGFPVQYFTAYNCLHGWGNLRSDEAVLVHAAAGGVGSAAVQLASAAGATVFATASSERKLDFARRLGADHLIDYTETDFATAVDERTDGRGVDLVLDGVGGATFDASADVLAPFGRIVSIGSASGEEGRLEPSPLRKGNNAVIGFHLGTAMDADAERVCAALPALFELLTAGEVTVRIGERFPLAEAGAAHELIESRRNRGKVILHP